MIMIMIMIGLIILMCPCRFDTIFKFSYLQACFEGIAKKFNRLNNRQLPTATMDRRVEVCRKRITAQCIKDPKIYECYVLIHRSLKVTPKKLAKGTSENMVNSHNLHLCLNSSVIETNAQNIGPKHK